jgi:hypothetical protein
VKIKLVTAEMFHADRQTDGQMNKWTDRQTDMTKLILTYCNISNATKTRSTVNPQTYGSSTYNPLFLRLFQQQKITPQ